MNDEQIIELYFARDENAITCTDKKYGSRCRRTAMNILANHEDSEECVSDTYLRLWNNIPPKRPSPLLAFILKIVRNLSLDRIRRSSADKRIYENYCLAYDEMSECVPSDENVERTVEAAELTGYIEKFLEKQTDEKKRIFLMRYFELSSVSEIASALDISESKVKVTLLRMRGKLKDLLEKEGIGL